MEPLLCREVFRPDQDVMVYSVGVEEREGSKQAHRKMWFDLVEEVTVKYGIVPETTYRVDEVGTNPFSGEKEWVIGARQAALQHQKQDGNRENITVLMTICVDGTTLPPAAIFKGRAFQMKWKQDNPADAARVLDIMHKSKYTHSVYSIACLERGWTNGEIGVKWISSLMKKHMMVGIGCCL